MPFLRCCAFAVVERKSISYDSLLARQMARLSEMEEYKGLSETELQEIAYDETIAEMSETILTDTDAANRLSRQIYKQDRTLWQKIKDFFTGLVEKLRSAYKDSDPDSDIGRMLKRAVQDNAEIAQAWAEAVSEAGENYQLQDGQKKNAREGVRPSIRKTQNMSWDEQVKGALYGDGGIVRNDTLVVGEVADFLAKEGIEQKPLAIPLSILSKASSGKDVSHSIKRGKLVKLDAGIESAPIVIVNPARNAIVFVTDIKQGGAPILAAFDRNATFDGDNVHKATSIHLQMDVQSMLENLPASATVYVKNENELAAVGATNNLRGLAANVKFISEGIVNGNGKNVNGNVRYSARNQTESENFKQWFGDWQNDPANASKAVNADGTPKVLYHQTSADFTIFEPRHEGAGTRDQDTPFGIFMKSSDRNIGVKGEKQMALYARIVNLLRVTDRADLMYQLGKISPEYERASADLRSLNDAYQQKHEEAKKAFADYLVKWRRENPNASRTAIYDDAAFNEVYEAEDKVLDEWEAEARKVELRSKEAITRDLEKQGYDGVIIQTDKGSFGRSTDAYIALHPEQVKSATDNVGTFDKSNPDIRFSDRNSQSRQVERLEKKNAELKAEAKYLKQVVKVQKSGNKAHILDRSSVNAIGKGLMESVNAKGSEFGKLLNDFYRALGTEDMSYEAMQDRAGELAALNTK